MEISAKSFSRLKNWLQSVFLKQTFHFSGWQFLAIPLIFLLLFEGHSLSNETPNLEELTGRDLGRFKSFLDPTNPRKEVDEISDESIREIARAITVRIFTNSGAGSGVIVKQTEQNYLVLTNDHVVAESQDNDYTVMTADEQIYSAQRVRSPSFGTLDLALLEFRSDRTYQVVEIADSHSALIGDRIYAAGFPNWQFSHEQGLENTQDWGANAFEFTSGELAVNLTRSLKRGYQLGYTNAVENGMSGGPVLDQNGFLIGINGRLKYPIQGIRVFEFVDGTLPSIEEFKLMESLSWAIPTSAFQTVFP